MEFISLAPGFSQVLSHGRLRETVSNAFPDCGRNLVTWLQPGANEMLRLHPQAVVTDYGASNDVLKPCTIQPDGLQGKSTKPDHQAEADLTDNRMENRP
jgi:hypothetical protein